MSRGEPKLFVQANPFHRDYRAKYSRASAAPGSTLHQENLVQCLYTFAACPDISIERWKVERDDGPTQQDPATAGPCVFHPAGASSGAGWRWLFDRHGYSPRRMVRLQAGSAYFAGGAGGSRKDAIGLVLKQGHRDGDHPSAMLHGHHR